MHWFRRWQTVVAAAGLAGLWLIGLAAYPLLESTEGRYGSIAAAMARGSGFLEPRFGGLLYFAKPPLAYWAGAAAHLLRPGSELVLRLPATLALLVSVWLIVKIGRAGGLPANQAHLAGLLAGLAPLAVIQGRMLSSDIFLWAGILAVYLGMLAEREPGWRRALWAGMGLAVGFLAKGHLVLFWVLPPGLIWAFSPRGQRALGVLGHPVCLVTFLALATPWFLAVLQRNPGLEHFWWQSETLDRFFRTTHGRAEPWWYFPVLLPAVILPWLPEAYQGVVQAIHRGRERGQARLLWLLWAGIPFLLLCCSGSKRPNYLLPLIAPLALLAAAALPKPPGRSLRLRLGGWLLIVLASPFLLGQLPGIVPPTRAVIRQLPGAVLPAGGLVHQLPAPRRELIAYRVFPSSLEYYWGRPVPVVQVGRGPIFDPPAVARRYRPSPEEMVRRVRSGAWLLLRERDRDRAAATLGFPLAVVARQGELVVVKRDDAGRPK